MTNINNLWGSGSCGWRGGGSRWRRRGDGWGKRQGIPDKHPGTFHPSPPPSVTLPLVGPPLQLSQCALVSSPLILFLLLFFFFLLYSLLLFPTFPFILRVFFFLLWVNNDSCSFYFLGGWELSKLRCLWDPSCKNFNYSLVQPMIN